LQHAADLLRSVSVPSTLHRTCLLAALLAGATALVLLVPAARADTVPPVVVTQPGIIISSDFSSIEACEDHLDEAPPSYTLCTREELTGDRGTWTDESSLSFTYQWLSCDIDGSGCRVTSTFTGDDPAAQPLLLGPDQVDRTVRFRVVATGPGGTTIATSEYTNVVVRGPATRPVAQVTPSVDGDPWPPVSGTVLTGRIGTWDDAYHDYYYDASWERCDVTGVNCIVISTQRMTGPAEPVQRNLTGADVGSTLRLSVTASTLDPTSGFVLTKVEYSPPTPIVQDGGPPVMLEAPLLLVGRNDKTAAAVVSGPVNPGDTLTATAGRWTVNDRLVVNWLRCSRAGTDCVSIPGANALPGQPARQSYLVTSADLGSSIRADVTATALLGSTTIRTAGARVGPDASDPGTIDPGKPVKERATVRVRSAKVTGSGNTLAVYLSLGAAGKVSLTATGGGTTLGKVSRQLGKGNVAIALKLSKKARKVLGGRKKVKTTLSLTLRTSAGNKGSLRQSLTLRGTSR
jgi:hypothetical protein